MTDQHDTPQIVTTTVYSIGGRSEQVTGQVVGERRNALIVQTEAHGRIVVPLSKIEAS
jgi:RNase P/RNase MRP subunit p29